MTMDLLISLGRGSSESMLVGIVGFRIRRVLFGAMFHRVGSGFVIHEGTRLAPMLLITWSVSPSLRC